MKKNVYLVDGTRTPFCKMGTTFAKTSAADLGVSATKALFAKMDLNPDVIDESVMGCVCQPADTANITRVIALKSGVPRVFLLIRFIVIVQVVLNQLHKHLIKLMLIVEVFI
jgi:acetyl-CoA acetyltransferase